MAELVRSVAVVEMVTPVAGEAKGKKVYATAQPALVETLPYATVSRPASAMLILRVKSVRVPTPGDD